MKKRERKVTEQEKRLEELVFGKQKKISDTSNISDNIEDDSDYENPVEKNSTTAVWKDDEEEQLEIDLSYTARLKKLIKKSTNESNIVSGTQFSNLLRERFSSQSPPIDWTVEKNDKQLSLSDQILSQSRSVIDNNSHSNSHSSSHPHQPLSSSKLNIRRVMDANFTDPSKNRIAAINFHPTESLMLTAGYDKVLRFFKIDGEKNEKQLSVRFNDMAILSAQFSPLTSEVILGGRKPYFYSYDTESGSVSKIQGLIGKRLKTHEKMILSPEGSKLAVMGSGGYTHIIDSKYKSSIMDIKMNSPMRSQCWLNDMTLITSGLDAEVYIWDIRIIGRCLQRFQHEDGMCSSSLGAATFNNGTSHIAVGSESGVVSIYQYNHHSNSSRPTLLKSLMNLTTKINCTRFHPSGQLLAIASDEKTDQLRVAHIPTGLVYNNWPTENTPTRKVECVEFSPGGGYMAMGNNKGKVLLYRLNHFDSI